jgi:hypothetical protein
MKEKLTAKKITLATYKSFIKKSDKLYLKVSSRFDGNYDCCMEVQDQISEVSKEGLNIPIVTTNYFRFIENEEFYGIQVSNCCGRFNLYTK